MERAENINKELIEKPKSTGDQIEYLAQKKDALSELSAELVALQDTLKQKAESADVSVEESVEFLTEENNLRGRINSLLRALKSSGLDYLKGSFLQDINPNDFLETKNGLEYYKSKKSSVEAEVASLSDDVGRILQELIGSLQQAILEKEKQIGELSKKHSGVRGIFRLDKSRDKKISQNIRVDVRSAKDTVDAMRSFDQQYEQGRFFSDEFAMSVGHIFGAKGSSEQIEKLSSLDEKKRDMILAEKERDRIGGKISELEKKLRSMLNSRISSLEAVQKKENETLKECMRAIECKIQLLKTYQELHITREDENQMLSEKRSGDPTQAFTLTAMRSFANIRESVECHLLGKFRTPKGAAEIQNLSGELLAEIDKIKDGIFLSHNETAKTALSIIKQGKFKNIWEFDEIKQRELAKTLGSSGGYLSTRRAIEEIIGQFPSDTAYHLAVEDETRQEKNGPASTYGSVRFVFDLGPFAEQIVFIEGDSINPSNMPETLRTEKKTLGEYDNVKNRIIDLSHLSIAKAIFNLQERKRVDPLEHDSFIEAQTSVQPFLFLKEIVYDEEQIEIEKEHCARLILNVSHFMPNKKEQELIEDAQKDYVKELEEICQQKGIRLRKFERVSETEK